MYIFISYTTLAHIIQYAYVYFNISLYIMHKYILSVQIR